MTEIPSAAPMIEAPSVEISRKAAVKLAAQWIAEKRPGAMVRFGEGEGRLMVAQANDPESVGVARRKIKRQTGQVLKDDAVLAIREDILEALDEADVIGIHGDESFNDEHLGWVRAIEEFSELRAAKTGKGRITTHCLVNSNLSNELPSLLSNVTHVTVFSCRDVVEVVQNIAPRASIRVVQIPSQFVKREIDDEYESRMHGIVMWPDFYSGLKGNLEVREQGEVFLVGAGLFGKVICTRAKKLGGIALDIGSRLDFMAGKSTRRGAPSRIAPQS